MAKKHAIQKFKSKAKNGVQLLEEVKQLILDEPLRYNQCSMLMFGEPDTDKICASHFHYKSAENDKVRDVFPDCGTIGCVAGWITTLKAKNPRRVENAADFAIKLLKLKGIPYNLLFGYDVAGDTVPQTRKHALAGAAAIDYFIDRYRDHLESVKV